MAMQPAMTVTALLQKAQRLEKENELLRERNRNLEQAVKLAHTYFQERMQQVDAVLAAARTRPPLMDFILRETGDAGSV
jgi:hypothetical protein